MSDSDFVHLHLHTQYSLLDGAITIENLVAKVKEYRMPAVAMTDHGNLFGAIDFYQQAVRNGIKPILGCEVYIQSDGSRFEKKLRRGHEPYHHLVLLAIDREGYQNLCRLVTAGHLEGFYYKPRIDKAILRDHSKGLIVLSGCLSGEMAEAALAQGLTGARRVAEEFLEIFGDRFYLEVQGNSLPDQRRFNQVLTELSRTLSIPLVATNDCHYLRREDAPAHEALLCIQTGKTLQEEDRMRFSSDEFYLRSPEEMREIFQKIPAAIATTSEIASRIDLAMDFKTYTFPKYQSPDGKKIDNYDDYLEQEVWRGFEERWGFLATTIVEKGEDAGKVRKKYEERLRHELQRIRQMGFSGYFLIVADFINYAKGQSIPVGPGRGSAAGSLVAYCLRITDLDPIPYNLLFERFLNPERISMPDMDIDFCMNRRDEVIRYVQQKYGNVGQIITFGKMKAKAVVRDVGRVMNIPYKEVDRIAKLIPNTLNITLDEACRSEVRLREMEERDPAVKKLLTIARSLEGLNRHASTHAAGVVISDRPLVDFVPLSRGQNDEIVTQYDMKSIEKIGLIKFDFLGLKTLTVIDQALKIVKRTHNREIKINEIPLDDPDVYRNLATGDTTGIFQLESSGMRDLIVKMKPSVFPDLIALVALYRPGPLGSGMVDEFINRKHGRVEVRYELPELESILKETRGVIVYQEQVMQIASTLADFSLGDADILRRAMGKKKPEEMAEQRDKFLKGCQAKKIPSRKAEKIFDQMAKFAEYGFNKSHSAAYAFISYQTAWLKTHFPVEYTASLLTHEMGNADKMIPYLQDAREHGIVVQPPDINESFSGFAVTGERTIRFGLAAVKNVGEAAIDSIVEARKRAGEKGFRSFAHFCEEIDARKVNRRVLEGLIKCGAFDSMGISRSVAFQRIDWATERAAKIRRERESGQANLFGLGSGEGEGDEGSSDQPEWSQRERLAFEKESIGFYMTGHPLDDYQEVLKSRTNADTASIRSSETDREGKEVCFGGVVSSLREVITKNGDRMGFVTVEDLKGTVSVIVFPDLYRQVHRTLTGDEPILIRGTVQAEEDAVRVVAKEIVPIGSVEKKIPPREIHFQLAGDRIGPVTRERLEDLKSLLRHHQGPVPAYIHLPGHVLSLPEGLKVDPSSDLVQEVDRLFGSPVTVLH